MFEMFDHTADLGVRVVSPDLPRLFEEAGTALFSLIVDDLAQVRPLEKVNLRIGGVDKEYLLLDWLRELLTCSMSATSWQVPSPLSRMQKVCRQKYKVNASIPTGTSCEVKAITLHGFQLRQEAGSREATFIVDI